MWELQGRDSPMKYLIRDHAAKFATAFDTVFRSQGIDIIPMPYRAPNANAYAARMFRSVREECLDKLLIFNYAHLRRVMCDYTEFFNTARPYQGIAQHLPAAHWTIDLVTGLRNRDVLVGIIHDYYRDAA